MKSYMKEHSLEILTLKCKPGVHCQTGYIQYRKVRNTTSPTLNNRNTYCIVVEWQGMLNYLRVH